MEAERTVGEVHKAILAHNRADRGPSRSRSRSRRGATATAEAALGRNASGRSEKGSALVLEAEATLADGRAEAEAAAAATLDRHGRGSLACLLHREALSSVGVSHVCVSNSIAQ